MIVTKHGVMRFKQRQKVKNKKEMRRKAAHAIQYGKIIKNKSKTTGTKCYLYNGFYYIFTDKEERLVTLFPQNKKKKMPKRDLLNQIFIKDYVNQKNELYENY